MKAKAARSKDRRTINISTPGERRGSGKERRRCPECQAALSASTKSVGSGTVITLTCSSCGYTQSSRQTDAALLMARLTWALTLEKKAQGFQAAFPAELAEALKLKAGDELILAPLTLPMGSLEMRWALTVKRKGAKKA